MKYGDSRKARVAVRKACWYYFLPNSKRAVSIMSFYGHRRVSSHKPNVIITKITKTGHIPLRISNGERRLINGERRLIIPNSTFVQSCDQIVSSFWSHDFTILLSIYFCIWVSNFIIQSGA